MPPHARGKGTSPQTRNAASGSSRPDGPPRGQPHSRSGRWIKRQCRRMPLRRLQLPQRVRALDSATAGIGRPRRRQNSSTRLQNKARARSCRPRRSNWRASPPARKASSMVGSGPVSCQTTRLLPRPRRTRHAPPRSGSVAPSVGSKHGTVADRAASLSAIHRAWLWMNGSTSGNRTRRGTPTIKPRWSIRRPSVLRALRRRM